MQTLEVPRTPLSPSDLAVSVTWTEHKDSLMAESRVHLGDPSSADDTQVPLRAIWGLGLASEGRARALAPALPFHVRISSSFNVLF